MVLNISKHLLGCSDIYISRQSRSVSFEISRSSSSIFLLIFKGVDSVIEFIQKNPYCNIFNICLNLSVDILNRYDISFVHATCTLRSRNQNLVSPMRGVVSVTGSMSPMMEEKMVMANMMVTPADSKAL